MYRNQQNLYPKIPPTVVAELLQYSNLGLNLGMGFLHVNDFCSWLKKVNCNLDFKAWLKTVG